ncbi:MAG: hypothetical protein EHM49_00240 [Deltaproteobacteria bacterium]|nr:MAG: hypothetical protein EHM49_00240 [Deltaproteobacteria bacterium]
MGSKVIDIAKLFTGMEEEVADIPDEVLQRLAFAVNPFIGETIDVGKDSVDEDGFPLLASATDFSSFHLLQKQCWTKFVRNPQINSYVRDYAGNLTGFGFGFSSEIVEINDVLDLIIDDPRNSLMVNLTKYVARSEVEGELFLPVTLHQDGFVEVDFADPSSLRGGGDRNSGIVFHPKKPTMPLMYLFNVSTAHGTEVHAYPSIYLAYYPGLYDLIKGHQSLTGRNVKYSKKAGKPYSAFGGFNTFIVSWNKGYLTPRNVSHIRTTIEWLNHYETLKKYEIDHKKSSGAYLWVAMFEDMRAFRTWMALSTDEKAETGLMAKKTPGGTLVVPPGMKLQCINPQLTNISGADTDIMRMAVSGLNRPEDMITGVSSGTTFAGIKATRGPQADRLQDDLSYFKRFLLLDFWRAIFFLHSAATGFPDKFRVQEVIGFNKKKEPITRWVRKSPHKLVEVSFPQSEISNMEGSTKSLLGVKHGSVVETLGISKKAVAQKLGFSNYRKLRYEAAEEELNLPPTLVTGEAESAAEPKKKKKEEKEEKPSGDEED